MIDILIKAAIAVGAAVATYIVANEAVKVLTNKDIPNHLYGWWSAVRDRIVRWKLANPESRAARIIGEACFAADAFVTRLKRTMQMVTLNVFAVEGGKATVVISEETFPLEDLGQQFPGVKVGEKLDLTNAA